MTIKLHDLRPAPGSKTAKTRVGRGEGSKGKTAGRGTKGTKARKNVPATFEGGQMPIHMRLPKLKGFRNRFRTEYEVVNVGDLNKLFPKGRDVGVAQAVEPLDVPVAAAPATRARRVGPTPSRRRPSRLDECRRLHIGLRGCRRPGTSRTRRTASRPPLRTGPGRADRRPP